MMLDSGGGTFPCHKTTIGDEDGDLHAHGGSRHCAGALIFAEKNKNVTQAMRIAERLGWYKVDDFMKDKVTVRKVFTTLSEMRKANKEVHI